MSDTAIVPFCRGVHGREQCDSCAGKLAPGEAPPLWESLHRPWPFEPCPHYLPKDEAAGPEDEPR